MAFNDRYSALLDKCVTSLTTWKKFMQENLKEPEHDIETAKLQDITKEYCVIDDTFKRSGKAIALLQNAISDPSQTYDIDAMYDEYLSKLRVEDPTNNEMWQQICCNDRSVREVKPRKQKDNEHYERVDDSLMCSSSFTAPIDPISKRVIRKPLRNRKCGHVYDGESIFDYIRQSGRKAKCPYMGCKNNSLTPANLQEDPQMEKQITQFLASQQAEDSSSDDDSD